MKKALVLAAVAFVFLTLPGVSSTPLARADSLVVTSLADSGPGSLRDILTNANANGVPDTITFASGLTGSIQLASSLDVLGSGTTIDGSGAGVTIDGGSSSFPIFQAGDCAAPLDGFTLSNVAIQSSGGSGLRLCSTAASNITISGNTIAAGGSGVVIEAGSISNLRIESNPLIRGNSSGVAIFSPAVTNVRISSNGAITGSDDSGIKVNSLTLQLTQLTIQDNESISGGKFGIIFITPSDGDIAVSEATIQGNRSITGATIALRLGVIQAPAPAQTTGRATFSKVVILDNGIRKLGASSNFAGLICFGGPGSSLDASVIAGNSITNELGGGVGCTLSPAGQEQNQVTANTINAQGHGLAVGSNVIVSSNTVHAGAQGIRTGPDAIVTDNTVEAVGQGIAAGSNSTVSGNQVHVQGGFPAYGISVANSTLVANNKVHDTFFGVLLAANSSNVRVVGNDLTNNGVGVVILSPTGTGNSAHFNSITTNYQLKPGSQGVNNNDVSTTFDAENNWWGCDAGPAGAPDNGCSKAVGNVDYDPWLQSVLQVDSFGGPSDPQGVGSTINVVGAFAYAGPSDHAATIDWDDGTTSAGVLTESSGTGSVSGSHVYPLPGVYRPTLTVTDERGAQRTAAANFVVVYDPAAGFVTGGGWIDSPAGAFAAVPTLVGKATFGFVSGYKKGASVPTGQTEFQFQVGSLDFHSTAYEWLVVAGARAQFKGTGSINGNGTYEFLLTAIDGQINGGGYVDKFRIKIWDKGTGASIYDNQMGADDNADPSTLLQGGSIVIHKP